MPCNRRQKLDTLHDASLRDATRATIVAVASALPVIGPLAAAYLDQYLPQQAARRVEEFLGYLDRDLRSLGGRVDAQFVRVDEFLGFFEDAAEHVASRRAEGKRAAYAAAVANATLTERPDEEERFRLIDSLDALRPHHLRLLAVVRGPEVLTTRNRDDWLRRELPSARLDSLWRDWADLARQGLVPEVPGEDAALLPMGDVSLDLTPLGRRFLDFITSPSGEDALAGDAPIGDGG